MTLRGMGKASGSSPWERVERGASTDSLSRDYLQGTGQVWRCFHVRLGQFGRRDQRPFKSHQLRCAAQRQAIPSSVRFRALVSLTRCASSHRTGSDDGSLVFMHGVPYKYNRTIKTHTSFVHSVAYSPTGDLFASAGADRKVRSSRSMLSALVLRP